MSEWFVTEKEKEQFHPNDWNLPLPWISAFIYTHIQAHFWNYTSDNNEEKNRPRVLQIGCAQGWDAVEIAKILKLPMINGELHVIDWFKGNLTVDKEEEWSIVIPGASTIGQWQESDLTEAGKLAKNIISNWPD